MTEIATETATEIATEIAVEVRNLTVAFGDFKAVNNITFKVKKGEIFGFLGANGAGKTTTIRVLCGLLPPTSGEALISGVDFSTHSNADRIKSKVGYMSQKFTLYEDLSVEENLDFIASLRKLDDKVYLERRTRLLKFIAFNRDLKSLVRSLPGGVKQQVSLVAAQLHDPEIVFLDEPTAGVTPAARAKFWELIRQLAASGKTIFVTTHYMDEAEQCGRIALMRTGEIIALDSPAGLKKTAFSTPIVELSSKTPLDLNHIAKLREEKAFESVEPYGMRLHAVIKDEAEWAAAKSRLSKDFEVREIEPSLEDVFIRMVEGKSR